MFVSLADPPSKTRETAGRSADAGRPDRDAARAALALLAERTRPVTSSRSRLLPVVPPLAGLLPEEGLQRGATIAVTGAPFADGGDRAGDDREVGVVSVVLALLSAASAAGSWCAFAGMGDLGAVAAHEAGLDLDRLCLVPRLGPSWAEVTAALLDGVDLVVLRPPFPPRPAMVRRLVARARERRSVLVVLPGRAGWPEPPDLRLVVAALRWDGAGTGDGYLRRRHLALTVAGRRAGGTPRRRDLWLPADDGAVAAVSTDPDGGAAGWRAET
jgi:hypothetical protein